MPTTKENLRKEKLTNAELERHFWYRAIKVVKIMLTVLVFIIALIYFVENKPTKIINNDKSFFSCYLSEEDSFVKYSENQGLDPIQARIFYKNKIELDQQYEAGLVLDYEKYSFRENGICQYGCYAGTDNLILSSSDINRIHDICDEGQYKLFLKEVVVGSWFDSLIYAILMIVFGCILIMILTSIVYYLVLGYHPKNEY